MSVGGRPTHAVLDRYLPKGHPDQDRTEKALEEIGHVAMAINEGIRDKENEGKVGDLCLLNTDQRPTQPTRSVVPTCGVSLVFRPVNSTQLSSINFLFWGANSSFLLGN